MVVEVFSAGYARRDDKRRISDAILTGDFGWIYSRTFRAGAALNP